MNYLLGDHPLVPRDKLGSQAITTNRSGNDPLLPPPISKEQKLGEEKSEYYPWGEKRWSSGTLPTTFQFTGQRREKDLGPAGGEGLYYYGARWYDSVVGRFISADTIIPGGVQGLDRYAYVVNNPLKYNDPSGHEYCESDNAVAEDCEGITEYLPDQACHFDADCYDAYRTYYQVVLLLGRAPTDDEILYMTVAMEYWAYTDTEGVAIIGQEALARNFFERCGKDGCQGSEVYRFLAGYQPWMGYASRYDMGSSGRAADLITAWNNGSNTSISTHVKTITDKKNTTHRWTSGMENDRPWQWYGPFSWDTTNQAETGYSSTDNAILTIDLGNNQGFWMFTRAQDLLFNKDAWGPQEARPE